MKKRYAVRDLLWVSLAFLVVAVASCKKDHNTINSNTSTTQNATPAHIGLYEAGSSIYKLIYLDVSKIGTQEIDRGLVFDTGSGGMVLDADSVLDHSMFTNKGIIITGDSLTYKGVTVTKDTSSIVYGDDNNTEVTVYGNLAYADVTIDAEGGNVVIKRLPFFLYYKAVDNKGNIQPHDDFDVFGVNEEYEVPVGSKHITSPLSYYTPATGLDKGFKMAALGTSSFSANGTYVKNVVTLGLTQTDLQSSGFVLSQLQPSSIYGYEPIVSGTITYNNSTISSLLLFDSGTEPYNYIENPNAPTHLDSLSNNAAVAVTTKSGFNYNFTVTSTPQKGEYLTYIENPRVSGSDVSIFSLEYFLKNEYLLDFTTHQLGLKNN
jgi:hypothetical protein